MEATPPVHQRGATLTECVAALAISAGTLHLVAPGMQDLVETVRLSAASQDLLADLRRARAEAAQRNRRVALCKSNDLRQCTRAGGWEQGWILFHDDNGNGVVDGAEEVLGRHEPLPAFVRARGNQPVADYVSYTALGMTKLVGGGFQAGTLTVCRVSASPTPARQVILNVIGRPRIQRGTVAGCDA